MYPTSRIELEDAERFVVAAARYHLLIRSGETVPRRCICAMFRSAGLMSALASFAFFQDVLSADPRRVVVPSGSDAERLSVGETLLLEAVGRWQQRPEEDSQQALYFIATPGIRRMAAPAGRAFAICMLSAGLVLPVRVATAADQNLSATQIIASPRRWLLH